MKTLIKLTLLALTSIILNLELGTLNCSAQVANGTGAGNCLSYDGTANYVSMGTSSSLDVQGNEFSIECWFNMPLVFNRALFVSDISEDVGIGFFINRSTSGYDGNAINLQKAKVIDQPVAYTFTANTWYHVVAVQKFSGANPSQVDYYVNGTLIGSFINSSAYTSSTGRTKGIAHPQQNVSTENYFNGQIDEVRIWNRALTQAEIRATMCKKLKGNENGLVGYWRFDEGSGSTAYDASPNGNNGTLH